MLLKLKILKNIALGEIDLNKVKNILRIGSHTEIGSEKTIRPNTKGDIFNDGSGFGIIGGYEFTVNPEDGTYQITGQKMLRTDDSNLVKTSGSDEWQNPSDAKGKIERFQDIPEIADKDLAQLVDKLVNECKNEFDSALSNDFNTPLALTVYYKSVSYTHLTLPTNREV